MLCPGCFEINAGLALCPHCGYDESLKRSPLVLPHHTLLYHDRYRVGRLLGKPGGFGLTYLGWDERLETKVAIKEYLPRDLAGREHDQYTVSAHSGEDAQAFTYGLGKFLEEARTLAKLDHPNLVRVRDFFEDHGTAYLVMDYYPGLTLAEYLSRQPGGRMGEEPAIGVLLPILDGLREVHAKGFLHRDIKPQNIYLTTGNRPILLDFGAARQAMGEHSRSLSVVLSEGYAPIEQYQRNGRQGPWTDVYGAAATLYTMVTGQVPPAATDRIDHDHLPGLDALSPRAIRALRQGVAPNPAQRPASIEEWQRLLLEAGEPTPSTAAKSTAPAIQPARPPPTAEVPTEPRQTAGGLKWNGWLLAVTAIVFGVFHYWGKTPSGPAEPMTEPAPLKACDVCPEMVRLPGGNFLMGSPESEPGRSPDERQHRVTVGAFGIGKYEVTQAEWQAVMGDNPSHFKYCDRCPVEQVSWHDIQDYLQRLNARTGQRYRLPTEAEWEYACRADGYQRYCGSDTLDAAAWYDGNSGYQPHPVGQKPPNAFGLYDMSGNVWEWTASAYVAGYDGRETKATNDPRVNRGGSWFSKPGNVRAAYRVLDGPTQRTYGLGFRLAQD